MHYLNDISFSLLLAFLYWSGVAKDFSDYKLLYEVHGCLKEKTLNDTATQCCTFTSD